MINKLIDYFTRRDLIKRIEALEKLAHPKCGLEGFDGYEPLIARIEKLEKNLLSLHSHAIARIETIEEKTKENAS